MCFSRFIPVPVVEMDCRETGQLVQVTPTDRRTQSSNSGMYMACTLTVVVEVMKSGVDSRHILKVERTGLQKILGETLKKRKGESKVWGLNICELLFMYMVGMCPFL